MVAKQLVWLITGTSAGFGSGLAYAALKRGDKVIATARPKSVDKLADLKAAGAATIALDVTDTLENLKAIVAEAIKIYGRIDVLVNNAAYIEVGALEEYTPEETYAQYNTNIFGVLNVSRAVLPYMRAQKSGTIFMIGSVGGWRGGIAYGLYASTKFATRGLAESLDMEISPLGVRCHYLEPGYFRTSFLADTNRAPYKPRIPDYDPITKPANDALVAYNGKQPGDPSKFVEFMVDMARGEGPFAGREVPRGLPVGSDCFNAVKETCENMLKLLNDWEDVIKSTDFPEGT